MKPRHPKASLRAFTLIELLVVVSIISVLVAMSMPSLSRARMQARATVCGTRIKGLSTAFQTYLAEFETTAPVNGLILPKAAMPTMYAGNPRFAMAEAPNSQQWRLEYGALWPYMPGGSKLPLGYSLATAASNPVLVPRGYVREGYKAYLCPEDDLARTYTGSGSTSNPVSPLTLDNSNPHHPIVKQGPGEPGYWSYSVNSVLNSLGRFRNRFNAEDLPWNDPLRMMKVKATHDFICFIEEDKNSLFNDEVFDAPAYSEGDMLTNRHGGYGYAAFGDGHAEKFSATIFNHVPSGISGAYVDNKQAMESEVTRMFFPDRGAFALP
jgi:prepilin-type N-terminal cleavage/methylation domain-containing protein/prepilin-type processing-associated H-X9-DG protein